MLWTFLIIVLGLWLLGYFGQVSGESIHLLLFAAVIVVIYHLVTRRRVV